VRHTQVNISPESLQALMSAVEEISDVPIAQVEAEVLAATHDLVEHPRYAELFFAIPHEFMHLCQSAEHVAVAGAGPQQ